LAVLHRRFGKQTTAEEIPLGNADFAERTVGGRIAARYREVAGGFLFEIDDENHAIARRSRLGVDFHAFEVIEILQAALGAIDQRAIVRIALGNIEFSADHVIPGAGIIADVDALDIGPWTFVDGKDDRDGVRLEIAIAARTHDRKRVAPSRSLDLHSLDRLLHRLGVVKRPDIDARETAQRISIKRADAGLEIDRRNSVLLTLLDLEGHQEALALRIVFRQRGDYLHIGKTVLQVIAADQVAVGFNTVRIIDVVAAEKAQQTGLMRLDDILETVRRIKIVADEFDRFDAGFSALDNRENKIDAVVGLFDDFGA